MNTTHLQRHVIMPAFDWLKGRATFSIFRDLELTQWLDRAELEQMQTAALRRLLIHARRTCEYFRSDWQERGLNPENIESLQDFRAWPIMHRDTVTNHSVAIRSTQPGLKVLSKSTGGSTGVPLRFELDTGSNDRRTAAWHRGYAWANAGPGTKQLYLWGTALNNPPAWKRAKDYLYHRFQRRLMLNSFNLTEQNCDRFYQTLNRYQPHAIVAYTGALYAFARMLEERKLQPFSPKGIVVGAEKLHAFQRELIERVFGAPVYETYGSREFMLIGAECDRREGLHLTMEHLLVEVVDEEGRPTAAGDEGDVVITDLYNYGMPFVRYATGDRAVAGWEQCSCGRGLPLLRKVVGRQLDVLHTPDGRHLPGEFFPHLMKDFAAVRQFQVIQHSEKQVEMLIVAGNVWNALMESTVSRCVEEALGPQVDFALRCVEQIPLTTSGKHRVVVSKVTKTSPTQVLQTERAFA